MSSNISKKKIGMINGIDYYKIKTYDENNNIVQIGWGYYMENKLYYHREGKPAIINLNNGYIHNLIWMIDGLKNNDNIAYIEFQDEYYKYDKDFIENIQQYFEYKFVVKNLLTTPLEGVVLIRRYEDDELEDNEYGPSEIRYYPNGNINSCYYKYNGDNPLLYYFYLSGYIKSCIWMDMNIIHRERGPAYLLFEDPFSIYNIDYNILTNEIIFYDDNISRRYSNNLVKTAIWFRNNVIFNNDEPTIINYKANYPYDFNYDTNISYYVYDGVVEINV